MFKRAQDGTINRHKLMLDSFKVAYQHEQRLAKDFLSMYSRTVESVALAPK